MQWTKEHVLRFLRAYQKHPCIWDPNNVSYKNRNALGAAWKTIHESLRYNCTVEELKKKRDSLMAQFRIHSKKKITCLDSGAEEMYATHWFAYEAMEKFLGPIYLAKAIPFEGTSESYDEASNFKIEDLSNETFNSIDNLEDATESEPPPLDVFTPTPSLTTTRNFMDINKAEEYVVKADTITKNTFKPKRRAAVDEDDECELYGKLLAKKLRRFGEQQREIIMFEIDGLIIQKRKTLNQMDSVQEASTSSDNLNGPALSTPAIDSSALYRST